MSDKASEGKRSKDLPQVSDANKLLLDELTGRAFQAALIGEGLVCGGLKDIGNELKIDNLWTVGGSLAGGCVLGAVLTSKQSALKAVAGAIGTIGGGLYTAGKIDQYSKNKELAKSLDAVYKHHDWKVFNKQTHTAEKVLGREGFDAALFGVSGSVGLAAGMKFGPGALRRLSPEAGQWLYGKTRADKASPIVKRTFESTPLNRDLKSFVNRVSHGDVHVAQSAERSKPFIFDKDNRITNIFVQKGTAAKEIERQIVVGSLADRIGRDKQAMEVVLKGAEKANYHAARPEDLSRAAEEGVPYFQSQVGQVRKLQGAHRYAIEGGDAFFRNQKGNDYTEYLRKVHGPFSGKREAEARGLVVSVPIIETVDAMTHRVASENLAGLGIRPSDYNLAAAKNTHIQKMDDLQKKEAVRAVSYYLNGHPANSQLSSAQRIEGLEKLSRNLTATQVEAITKRVGEFDPQYFPHYLFDGPVMTAVDNLISSGLMKDVGKTHKLISRLAGQANQETNVEFADLLIHCARNAGMTEEQLMKKGVAEAGSAVLKELILTKQKGLVSDLAFALRHLEGSTNYKHVAAVSTMRERGWKLDDINATTIIDHVASLSRRRQTP